MSPPKTESSPASAPDLDILGDQVTIHPTGYVEPPPSQDEGHERNLVEHMARFRESPLDFLREVSLHVSGMGWRAYDDVLGQPIFYSGFSENMKAAVMKTAMLRRRIEDLAERRVEVEEQCGLLGDEKGRIGRKLRRKTEIETNLREVALELTDGMICKMESKRFIRGAYYLWYFLQLIAPSFVPIWGRKTCLRSIHSTSFVSRLRFNLEEVMLT